MGLGEEKGRATSGCLLSHFLPVFVASGGHKRFLPFLEMSLKWGEGYENTGNSWLGGRTARRRSVRYALDRQSS